MVEGVDYSFGRPDIRCLASQDKDFAVRYVGTPFSGKNLTRGEADALRAAGLDIVGVYQTTTSFMTLGFDRGVTAARDVVEDAAKYGYPAGRPIYYALDRDPRGLTTGEWSAVQGFCNGVASVTGRGTVGVYGGFDAIERLVPTYAAKGWQTYAWSAGRLSDKAHLYQYRNGQTVCGALVDLCRSLSPDYGQWSLEDDMPLTNDDIKRIREEAVRAELNYQATLVHGITSFERYLEILLAAAREAASEDLSEVAIATAVADKVLAGIDPQVIAAAVVTALPTDQAQKFLAALAAELGD